MTEYLTVVFPRQRQVLINGEPKGQTNDLLDFEEGGEYEVTLASPPADFDPPSQKIDLHGTAELRPLRVVFQEA